MNKRRTNNWKKYLRQELFWDVDPRTLDVTRHAQYIIERILDFGNDEDVRWMWNIYGRALIRSVVKRSHSLRKQTRPLWLLLTKR